MHRVPIDNWTYGTLTTRNYNTLLIRALCYSLQHTKSSQFATTPRTSGLRKCGFLLMLPCSPAPVLVARSVGRSAKLLLAFCSTVIPGFSLLEIHDQDFYSLLDKSQSQSYVTTDVQLASLSLSSTHLGPKIRFLLVRQLWVCWCGARSLTRGRVCVVYNCCWPSPTQPFSGPSPAGLMTIFLRLLHPGGPGPHIYIPQEQDGLVIPSSPGFLLDMSNVLGIYPRGKPQRKHRL
jgi:hypothetical protein